MDLQAFVAATPHLGRLSADNIDIIARAMVVQTHPPGHVLTREGDRGDNVFLLLQGEVEVGRVRDERWDPLNRLTPGALFGLVALIDSGHRCSSCRAGTEVVVGALNRAAFSVLLGQHAPIAQAFQLALCSQLARDFRNLERQIRAELEIP
jgi:CRP-like cAMP-binding protein